MSEWKVWIDLSAAVLTPVVAILGIVFTIRQYQLDCKKRKDELFDRRYAFYQKLREAWLSTHPQGNEQDPTLEDWIPFAEEAGFIFGKDIQEHILSLADRHHDGSTFFPNEDFAKPFRKYLELN